MPLKPIKFFSDDYKVPSAYDEYIKPSANDGGVIKFVILEAPIKGWSYWTTDKKQIRSREEFTATPNIGEGYKGEKQVPRHFWVFKGWDLVNKRVSLYEINVGGIQKDIFNLLKGDDFDFENFNAGILITTSKKSNRTEYKVQGVPVKNADQGFVDRINAGEFDKVMDINLDESVFATRDTAEEGEAPAPTEARTDLM